MPSIDDYFGGEFLKASDLLREMVLTIKDCVPTEVGSEDEKTDKLLLTFAELADKSLVLNRTNAEMVAQITGTRDYSLWKGKKIVLFKTKVLFRKQMVDAIRVRPLEQQDAIDLMAQAPARTALVEGLGRSDISPVKYARQLLINYDKRRDKSFDMKEWLADISPVEPNEARAVELLEQLKKEGFIFETSPTTFRIT